MLTVLLACTSKPQAGDTEVPVRETGATFQQLQPEWDIYGASEALRELLSLGLPGQDAIRDPYLSLVRGGDESCPNAPDDQFPEGRVPLSGCFSSNGTHYMGLSEYFEHLETFRLWGDLRMVRANGEAFEVAGVQEHLGYVLTTQGSFLDEGADGWLQKGLGAALTVDTHGDERAVRGGLAALEGQRAGWYELLLTESCASGEVRTRDTGGGWYTWTLDDCSCGTVTFASEELGATCIDLESLRGQVFP
jgi:hypothetical protein